MKTGKKRNEDMSEEESDSNRTLKARDARCCLLKTRIFLMFWVYCAHPKNIMRPWWANRHWQAARFWISSSLNRIPAASKGFLSTPAGAIG